MRVGIIPTYPSRLPLPARIVWVLAHIGLGKEGDNLRAQFRKNFAKVSRTVKASVAKLLNFKALLLFSNIPTLKKPIAEQFSACGPDF